MNEKQNCKNKNLFSQRSWSIMRYVVAEEYSKKKKLQKVIFSNIF